MLEIYHGSAIEVRDPKIIEVGFNKDFGNGFYCTNIDVQAKKWAIRKGKGRGFVSVYEYDYLKTRNLNILVFNEMTQEWLDFIAACRSGKGHSYDIVEGPMADDEIYTFVNQFLKGEISRTAFWELAKFRFPTHQTCFSTNRALEVITFERSFECERKDI